MNLQLDGLIFTYFSNKNNTPQTSEGVFERFVKVISIEFRVIFPFLVQFIEVLEMYRKMNSTL